MMQGLEFSFPLEQLMDVTYSTVEVIGAMLPSKDSFMDQSIQSFNGHKNKVCAEDQIGNLSAVSVSSGLSVANLSRTKLQGITRVSVPTVNQEVPVSLHKNGIRPSSGESLIRPLCTVSEKEEYSNAINKNDRDCSQLKQKDLLSELRDMEQCCNALKEENVSLRKNCFPATEEKIKRLKKKNAELAVIAKRLEERAHKLQEANLKMVNIPMHLKGPSLEVCKKAFARQRAKDMAEQACALLAKDKQIALLKQECLELQAKLTLGKECSSLFKLSDFDRLLRESQKEVLRLQRQIAIKYLKESLRVTKSYSQSCNSDATSIDSYFQPDQAKESPDKIKVASLGDGIKELELKKKRKECEILEQEVKKKQRRCEDLETKLQEVETENVRIVEENSQLSSRVKWARKVETENADLKGHLAEVTGQRDSALKESHHLQNKLDNLEQVLKHMRDVAERRQQLEKDHEDALTALQKRQEEVKHLQEAQVEAKKDHEEATKLLEAKVKTLEEKCRSQTEQFSQFSQELERFRLQTGDIGLLTCTLVTSELPPPQCCSIPGVPQVKQDFKDNKEPVNDEKINQGESAKERPILQPLASSCEKRNSEAHNNAVAKEKQKLEAPQSSSKSDSVHESPKFCPTPEVDTASEMEDLDADSISLNPEAESRSPAKLQVYLARYSYNPFDGPNENPEAELPLTAGEYIYIYGDMDDDGFYEGELMDGRRGLVPSNFVERVSDDDLIAFQPAEIHELSQSSGQDINFLSGSSNERSEDGSSLSPLPCEMQGTSEGASDILAVPYPRNLAIIKQLAQSVVVGWEPPLVTAGSGNIQVYNIYVDNELRQNVRCGGQTKALIEKLELKTQTYRISVQSVTEDGCSDRMRCTLLVGHGYSIAPTQLRVRRLSATCAEITWLPCNSNYSHALHMNDEECGLAKAGTYWYNFSNLRPSTLYNVKVEAQPQRVPWDLPLDRCKQKATVMQLSTPSAGPPDAPLDVQVELGPTPGVLLISWLPVTIDAAGSSNGVRVTGYAVYADGQKVLEVTSPTAGSVLVGMSHLQLLQVSKEISVRTMSLSGESIDSMPAKIPSALLNNPDCSSLLNPFSNSLINEPAMEKSLDVCFEKFPSKPLTSSSPCSPPATLDTCTKAKFSIHTRCSRGKSTDSLPVRTSPLLLHSPLSASSGYCQGSTGSDCLEPMISQDDRHENAPSALVQTTSVPVSRSVQPFDSAPDSVEISRITLQEKESTFLKESVELSDTKSSNIKAVTNNLQSTLEAGKTWNKCLTESNTAAKEDCSSPEMEHLEEVQKRNGNREISIEDFLTEGQEKTTTNNCTNEVLEREESLQEPTPSHLETSRSSTLSDIMEEEDNPEEEDSPKINSVKKRSQMMKAHCETSSKDDWNSNNTPSLLPDYREAPSPGRVTGASQLTSGSESEYHQEVILNKEESPLKPQKLETARIFVALFDYDPAIMSPNPDAYEEEVPFKEGQILQIFRDKDADGFYHGECAGKTGYIPCNMVSELHIQSEDVQAQLMKQGWVTSPTLINDLEIRAFFPPHPSPSLAPSGRLIIPPPKPRRSKKAETAAVPDVIDLTEKSKETHHDLSIPRKMVAIFDYNPRENSPNMDVEAELSFTAGDLITVYGQMDEDGFYYGELNGKRGLVPSNFLESAQPQVAESDAHVALHERDDTELRVESPIDPPDSPAEDSVSCGQAANYKLIPERQHLYQGIVSNKKKKSLFSKGQKLFKKLGSSGKSL
ncbi:peripheral-type benzodiazepine receptor-associated protein 1 isoform X2 [Xenopus laevis]|uniref:RIMS-binding protein 2 n=1 Tax=Xenopus laevis TaxID=8355 RepID=A0A8J1MD68_XENLA|nr:peripheral-type benzodiazepine receptor-associated protein 1 isoform X2 [Xenopus laevis]